MLPYTLTEVSMSSLKYLIVSGLVVSSAFGQTLNLPTAIHEVNKDSPYLDREKSSAQEIELKKMEAFSTYLPKLRANGTYLTDKKYQYLNINFNGPVVIPQIVPTSQFNMIAEWSIFDGFAGTNRYRASNEYADAAAKNLSWTQFRTEMEVTLAFYQAIAAKMLKEVAIQNVKGLEDHSKDARQLRKSGVSTNYDVLRVEVQGSNGKTDLADAEDDIIIARERLAEVLGHDTEERDLQGQLPVPQESVIDQPAQTASERSDLLALRLQSKARVYEAAAAGRHWVPEISLFGTYNFYNNLTPGFNDWSSYRNARQVGFMMTWNLFDGLASTSRAKQRIEQRVQAEKSSRMAELAAARDKSMWTKRYRSQCRIYQARVEDVKRSEESVRLAAEGRKVGARTSTELLDAETDLYRARAGAVRAQLGAVEALIKLQLAEGRRYTDFQ
jgi:outer membrane protein TolC